jgi:predicted enzyme related to lactoylglutathione lyase
MNEGIKGRFVWYELITSDTKSAAGFYSKVAGLKTSLMPGNSAYTMLVAGDVPVGGLLDTAAMGGPSRWLSFIASTNTDETVRQAVSLGGTVVKGPIDLPSGGRAAVLQDPQGTAFAVWSSDKESPASPDIPLGGISWHELATTDRAAAFSFYQSLFGWHETSSMDMGPQGVYQMFAPAGSKDAFGGIYSKAPGSPGGPNWLPYIKVADARPVTEVAKKGGAQILNGPMQVPGGGWISMGVDPQGALFAVHSAAAAAPAKKPAAAKRAATKRAASKTTRKVAKKKAAAKKSTAKKASPKKAVKRAATKKKAAKKKTAKASRKVTKKTAPRRAKRKAASKK